MVLSSVPSVAHCSMVLDPTSSLDVMNRKVQISQISAVKVFVDRGQNSP